MTRLLLVRHAMPVTVPGVDPRDWQLDDRAREDCVLLAHNLRGLEQPVFFSSDEPKASQTAAVLALRFGGWHEQRAAFGEVRRPATWIENHRDVAARYLATGSEPGWESPAGAVARFAGGVNQILTTNAGRDVVVATHGMVMSLYLASLRMVDDLVAFWRALTFPDAWLLDLESQAFERLFR